MSMSLATTHLLSQQLATLTARQNILQMQINDINGRDEGSDGPGASRDPSRAENELCLRIETNLRKSLRTALSGDVRDAIQRERQAVEEKIVQSVTLVSDDLAAEQQKLEDTAASQADLISALDAKVAELTRRVEAAEEKLAG